MSFEDLGLSADLLRAIREQGYTQATPVQMQAIPAILQGNDVLAIPHNGNASNGLMFPIDESYGGSQINQAYSTARMRNEPVYEITQIKGTSETHPALSPKDEFASFELWDYTLASRLDT